MENTRERLKKQRGTILIIVFMSVIWWIEPQLYTVNDACTNIIKALAFWNGE